MDKPQTGDAEGLPLQHTVNPMGRLAGVPLGSDFDHLVMNFISVPETKPMYPTIIGRPWVRALLL